MPKNFALESIRHHLLRAIERARRNAGPNRQEGWNEICRTLTVVRCENSGLAARWTSPRPGEVRFRRGAFTLYRRGDLDSALPGDDPGDANARTADRLAADIGIALGFDAVPSGAGYHAREQVFHDEWAADTRPDEVMVRAAFEAATAPENRFIVRLLGELRGRRILDLGSGLGEAAVFFATRGARVTACDLSPGMLNMVAQVAARHGVEVTLHRAAAEKTELPDQSFDVVYAGNLLHHVDIAATLDEVRRLLVPGGTVVTWDPIAHNPLINVYRRMATAVRTEDEHPLRMEDLALFRARFSQVGHRCFWLASLLIFVRFFLWERVHPSKERYWKKILVDADRLAPLFRRLERIDDRLLAALPWLERYCWNIVVWGRK